jgi:hypothetical protein
MSVVSPILSLTEAQAFTAMRGFLLQVCVPSDPTQPVQVIRGQAGNNQTPEPGVPDFVVMSPLRQSRLSYNVTSYADNVFTGSISETTLTVTEFAQQAGPLIAGMLLTDSVWPTMNIAPNTVIVEQINGTIGGVGEYEISPSQILAQETLYAGLREDLVPTELTIQLDIHGPASGDNAKIVEGLFRSEYGTSAFEALLEAESPAPPAWSVVPLYCEVRGEMPFVNESSQVEYRWVLEAKMQISPVISTPQQFADQVEVGVVAVNERYPP